MNSATESESSNLLAITVAVVTCMSAEWMQVNNTTWGHSERFYALECHTLLNHLEAV